LLFQIYEANAVIHYLRDGRSVFSSRQQGARVQTITKEFLDPKADQAQQFIQQLRRLYELET
jgi:hypothetical protein